MRELESKLWQGAAFRVAGGPFQVFFEPDIPPVGTPT